MSSRPSPGSLDLERVRTLAADDYTHTFAIIVDDYAVPHLGSHAHSSFPFFLIWDVRIHPS